MLVSDTEAPVLFLDPVLIQLSAKVPGEALEDGLRWTPGICA